MNNPSGTLTGNLTWNAKQTIGTGITSPQIGSTSNSTTVSFTSGTGSGQCDLWHEKVVELAASANTTFDLSSFTELATGTTVGFQKVKALVVRLEANADASTEATHILIEPNGTNGWLGLWKSTTNGEYLYKDGVFVMVEPLTGITVDGTHKVLKFTNQDASHKATFRITIGGIKA
jgi:hypothetical protein